MLTRSILIPFISLAIVLAVNGAPTPISPKPHENAHIANARSAVDFLEDREVSNVSNDNNLLRQNTVHSQLSNGLMERSGTPGSGLEAGNQNHPSPNTIVPPGKGKNYAENQRKKQKKKEKARLAHLAGAKNSPSNAPAESVHAHPTVALNEGEHKQEVKKEEPKPLTPEHKVETAAEKEVEKKKDEAKPLSPEHKEETPAEKKEDLNHGGATEGELPQPQTGASGADLATAATAAVGSLAQLTPMVMQGLAAGGSAGASSAVTNDVMGGGASSAKSGATGDSAPPSDSANPSTSSSDSSGDGSSSSATSSPDKKDTGDGKGDDASTNKDDADKEKDEEKDEKKDGEKGSDEDGKLDSNKNSDADSGNGSGGENVHGTKSATSTDGVGMRKRGTERYLRQIMSLD
ncbi:hypothetical protein F5050DRAFT_1712324 [Lentinula boryana]|uniref:Uncharacterized protein n=1 Tax=Lentinula boryana TaxID=40481 RepID=A0ABQ8QCB8_9AGAR|nr:hypothetical protein F5050DRAFT_1712324 [Lentinula boryana]